MMPTTRPVAVDERTRTFLRPVRIVTTVGQVRNAPVLLTDTPLQIHVTEPETVTLDNRDTTEKAGILLDFGRELQGGVRLLCAATPGARYPAVRLRFGESASEAMTPLGTKNAGNDHAVRDFVIPAPAMSDQEWGQTGFRFVYIELQEPDAELQLSGVLAVSVLRDIPQKGTFRCSDPRLNDIFDTAVYTCQLCMQHHLWDGIKRDRLIWIGDSHPEMLTIRTAFGYQKVLEDSLDDAVATTPLPRWMNDMPAYSLWWLCILRDWYHYTGDAAYPIKHRDYIRGLSRQIAERVDENGFLKLEGYFLDWPSAGTKAAEDGDHALAILALESARELLGLWQDNGYITSVDEALTRLRQHPMDGCGYKPTVAMLYLAGMASAEDTARQLTADGVRDFSTFMSFYLLTALARTTGVPAALAALRSYYGGMLDVGATTFWEDFHTEWMEGSSPIDRLPREGERDIHGDFGGYCYEHFRHSLCHGWASGPVPFLMETVLGIRFETPGGKRIRLTPALGDLDWAEGTYPLPDGGVLSVRCQRTETGVRTTYTAPSDITVSVDDT